MIRLSELADSVVPILRFGLLGLVFLFFLMAFFMIWKEQKRNSPRNHILSIVRFYIVMGLISVVVLGALSLLRSTWEKEKAEHNKTEIYQYLYSQLQSAQNEIARLRVLLAGVESKVPRRDPFGTEFFIGTVVTEDGQPISDARVEIKGGSQIFSLPNGEFYLPARPGDRLLIVKEGYAPYVSTIRQKGLNHPRQITLRR